MRFYFPYNCIMPKSRHWQPYAALCCPRQLYTGSQRCKGSTVPRRLMFLVLKRAAIQACFVSVFARRRLAHRQVAQSSRPQSGEHAWRGDGNTLRHRMTTVSTRSRGQQAQKLLSVDQCT